MNTEAEGSLNVKAIMTALDDVDSAVAKPTIKKRCACPPGICTEKISTEEYCAAQRPVPISLTKAENTTVPGILREGAATFEERAKIYGDNYMRLGGVLAALFPEGITIKTPQEFIRWHLFEMQAMKLTRLACAGLMHVDSAHDNMVYAAMFEKTIIDQGAK